MAILIPIKAFICSIFIRIGLLIKPITTTLQWSIYMQLYTCEEPLVALFCSVNPEKSYVEKFAFSGPKTSKFKESFQLSAWCKHFFDSLLLFSYSYSFSVCL